MEGVRSACAAAWRRALVANMVVAAVVVVRDGDGGGIGSSEFCCRPGIGRNGSFGTSQAGVNEAQ